MIFIQYVHRYCSSIELGPIFPWEVTKKYGFYTKQIVERYLQTPLPLPEFFPIGQWNRFKYRVFKLGLYENKRLLGHQKCTFKSKNGICIFMRCGHLTYDPWIWLKVTSMASTASIRKNAKNP